MSNCSQADSAVDDPKQRDLDVQPAEKAPPRNAQGEGQQTKVRIKIQLCFEWQSINFWWQGEREVAEQRAREVLQIKKRPAAFPGPGEGYFGRVA